MRSVTAPTTHDPEWAPNLSAIRRGVSAQGASPGAASLPHRERRIGRERQGRRGRQARPQSSLAGEPGKKWGVERTKSTIGPARAALRRFNSSSPVCPIASPTESTIYCQTGTARLLSHRAPGSNYTGVVHPPAILEW